MFRREALFTVLVWLGVLALALGAGWVVPRLLRRTVPPEGMVRVPAGEFVMGSNQTPKPADEEEVRCARVKPCYLDEQPQHRVSLPAFAIDRYEVSNQQYRRFVEQTASRVPPGWGLGSDGRPAFPEGHANDPVTGVNWYEAGRFCEWAGRRLPTEAEWEKAARGTDGREFPWGNAFDRTRANTGEPTPQGLMPVGSFPAGQSPYGAEDMSGNVWEWTADWYQPYPGSTYRSEAYGQKFKVIRGGSWGGFGHYHLPHFYRTAYRFYAVPEGAYPDVGFRCAR